MDDACLRLKLYLIRSTEESKEIITLLGVTVYMSQGAIIFYKKKKVHKADSIPKKAPTLYPKWKER